MRLFNQEFQNRHRKAINILFVISLITFVVSAVFLGLAILHSRKNNTKPLTYSVSIHEPPEGVAKPEKYEIVIPAQGNDPDKTVFTVEQDLSTSSEPFSMSCDVNVK